jgi:hypothetical protein
MAFGVAISEHFVKAKCELDSKNKRASPTTSIPQRNIGSDSNNESRVQLLKKVIGTTKIE